MARVERRVAIEHDLGVVEIRLDRALKRAGQVEVRRRELRAIVLARMRTHLIARLLCWSRVESGSAYSITCSDELVYIDSDHALLAHVLRRVEVLHLLHVVCRPGFMLECDTNK